MPRVKRKLVFGNPLWNKVSDGLQQGLSPEQVAGTLGRMNEPIRLCHETIYGYPISMIEIGSKFPCLD